MDSELSWWERRLFNDAVAAITDRISDRFVISSDFYYSFPDHVSSEVKSRMAQEVIGHLSGLYPRVRFSEVTGSVISVDTDPPRY